MNTSTGSTGLGLLSAASWSGSDFVGGIGARRAPAVLVTVSGQAVSLLILAVCCAAFHAALPGRHSLLLAAIGGLEASVALALFYRALAIGSMGLTAALTGLMTALVPLVFSAFHYGLPAPLTIAGLAAGCVAIWLITHQVSHERAPGAENSSGAALLLGTLAGVGFGAQLILFKLAEPASTLWIMTAARAAGIAVLLAIVAAMHTRGAARTRGNFWLPGISAGLLDTIGSLFFLSAVQVGRLDSSAVICSLYPAGTIVLAAMVLRERPTRRQMAAIALALGAVALLTM